MNKWKRSCIILFWLVIWQIAAALVHNSILLVGPLKALQTLWGLLPSRDFWFSIGCSFFRISMGFLAAFFSGILLGSLACRVPLLKDLLEPLMLFFKSVPVASFVILALIWTGSSHLAILIAFLVVLPVIYTNTVTGLESTDPNLLEMAFVFHIPLWKQIRFIYLPSLMPYLISACRISLGMSWKSGVAAEVIGLPSHSIGEQLYLSKIYLETADLFAWTLVIIAISALFERIVLFLISRLCPQSQHTDFHSYPVSKGESSHETCDP